MPFNLNLGALLEGLLTPWSVVALVGAVVILVLGVLFAFVWLVRGIKKQ